MIKTKNKRGIFFSTDAIIALSIILLTIMIAFPVITYQRHKTQLQSDIINTFSNLKINELSNSYVVSMINNGLIINSSKSILEEIGELYVTNKTLARELTQNMLSDLRTNENIGIWFDDALIFSINTTPYESASTINAATQTVSGANITSNTSSGFSARAYLSNTQQTKYFYFGGYIGDGNITININYIGNISSATIEAVINNDSSIYVNGVYATQCSKSSDDYTPTTCSIPINQFVSGNNNLSLKGNNLHIAGGFLRIVYSSEVQYEQPTRYYFPGIEGLINIYDGFYIPNTLNSMSIFLHLNSPSNAFLTIGNVTLYDANTSGDTTQTITNSQISAQLNYNSISNKTIPLRLGLRNMSITSNFSGDADVILITDVSGSMAWRLNNDNSGNTSRKCNDSLINDPSTARIALAKCIDKDFAATILSNEGNRIGLVSFSQNANSYVNLTTNQTLINNTINAYTASGSTCLSCAINRAYSILQSQSNSSRSKYILVMTDGVANDRSTTTCNNLYGVESNTTSLAGGGNGQALYRDIQGVWQTLSSPTSSQINDIKLLNSSFGFAVGNNGLIMRYDGSWSTIASPIGSNLNALIIYNSTYAIAVGDSGRIIKWNGVSWSSIYNITGGPTLYSVSTKNASLIFASGTQPGSSTKGAVYKSSNSGANWSSDYTSNDIYYGIKAINTTKAFAVGENGAIIQWNGVSWSSTTSPISHDLFDIDSINNTLAFAVGGDSGSSRVIKWSGSSWSSVYNGSDDSLRKVTTDSTNTYAVGDGAIILEFSGSSWSRTFNIPLAIEGNSTTGIVCTADQDSCDTTNSFPALNANYSSCRARQDLNATLNSVGFGPVATCNFAAQILQNVADCGNGSYYASSNASELQEFYESIANSILELSYTGQTSSTTTNISSKLYPDSYIEFNYDKAEIPSGLIVALENNFVNASYGTFSVPPNSTVVEAEIVSYSGAKWTTHIENNGNKVYNLSDYGSSFIILGDPFVINIPNNIINETNNLYVKTGLSPTNLSSGSIYNKVIYRIVKNASSYTSILFSATGCNWQISFEDGTNTTIKVPSNYSETDMCYFNSSLGLSQYNQNDAIQTATFKLLQQLDSDGDSKVDVNLDSQSLKISESQIKGIPFLWKTEVQARTWD
jgi:hypothetical protein